MEDVRILQSNKYEKFTFFDWNRPINETLISQLKKSMKLYGYIPSLPIIVSPILQIYDGQHRFLAAEELKMFFSYVIDEDFNVQQVWQSNKDRLTWRIADYVYHFSQKGNLDYKKLRILANDTGYSYKTLTTI